MNSNVLQQVLAALAARREENEREEERRRREVIARCPRIGQLMEARREAVMKHVYAAFALPAEEDLPARVRAWNDEIQHLLRENGFSADYLDPVFQCEKCQDTGYAGTGKKVLCGCAKALYAELLGADNAFEQQQCFESFNESVFPDTPLPGSEVTQRQYMRLLRNKCRDYADALPAPAQRTLLLYGGSGLGKTYLLRCVYERARQRDVPALCVTANQLIRTARKAIFSREQEELDALYETELLLIDDLGTEPLIENVTVEEVFNLINERQNARLCTVLSTNLSLGDLKRRYTERVFSRLCDPRACLTLHFLGQDVRRLPQG